MSVLDSTRPVDDSNDNSAQFQEKSMAIICKAGDELSCRVCLLQSSVGMEFLFPNDDQVISLAEQINQCCEIPLITLNDGFAQYICGVCREMLGVATRFRELCKQSDQEMRTIQHKHEIKVEEFEAEEYLMEKEGTDRDAIKFETVYTSVLRPQDWSPSEDTNPSNELSAPTDCGEILQLPEPQTQTPDLPYNLLYHIENHSNEHITHRCEHCGKILKTANTLKRHIATRHELLSYPCSKCPKSLSSKKGLRIHARTHLDDHITHRCEHCRKIFKSAKLLQIHIDRHDLSRDKSYQCLHCDKTFSLAAKLRSHLRLHSTDRPFVCELCGDTFKYKNTLRVHLITHENIRNFACSLCPYRTQHKGDLRKHERSHTGDKPYECPQCSLKFTNASNRKKHIRTVHEQRKDFSCDVCGRLFNARERIRRHMAVHTGIKRFDCQHCPNVYGHISGLHTHMKKLHPGFHMPSSSFFFAERPGLNK